MRLVITCQRIRCQWSHCFVLFFPPSSAGRSRPSGSRRQARTCWSEGFPGRKRSSRGHGKNNGHPHVHTHAGEGVVTSVQMDSPPNHNYRPNYLLLNQMFGLGRGPGWTAQSWLFTEVTAKKKAKPDITWNVFFTLSAARLRQIASRRVMRSCTLVVPRWMLLYKEFLFCFSDPRR